MTPSRWDPIEMTARDCATCGTANEADARFCEGCGTALERSCAGCGATASASARFCRACGAPLEAIAHRGTESPVRKTVTVMFADLAGSTGFEESVDPETARNVIGRYHDLLGSVADRHRAGVTKYIGDGFMAVWGVPEVGADDAGRAVEAAAELQQRFATFSERIAADHGVTLALRVAVNTGEVVVGSGDADLVGDALNVCARLESECPHGQVVVGEETWRCTRGHHRFEPLGRVQVKGRAAPVAIYQWLGHPTAVSESAPFVGRSDEIRRLHGAFDSANATRSARLVTVIGEPGVGKSRLAEEFGAARSDAVLIEIRCTAEGNGALGPFVDWMRTRDIDADVPVAVAERDRILRGLRAMTNELGGSVEETFWALRRFIEVLADGDGLILILDDIQWADPLLLDFVEHLAEWVRQTPVLMVALTRAELRESRPDLLAVGGWVSDAIRLRGLHPNATAQLAASVLGSDSLPPELLRRLPVSTGGNPLFVRELVGMLVHDGVLVGQNDGWRLTIDVDAITVPPTIQALLASRLERIHAADRRTLEVASVIGTEFSPTALAALTGLRPTEIRASLDRLRRLELAQPSGTYSADQPLWRFHHVLIRDVAYRRLLKSDRAELHQRLADWLLDGGAGNVADVEVARHLEAAYGYRCDLGIRDTQTADLGLRSARSYLASARRALDRDELLSAGTQATRGATLAVDDVELRAELLLIGCEALLSARDVGAAAPLVDELERAAGSALSPWATCYRCQFLMYTDPTRLPEVDDLLRHAIDEFTRRGDTSGLAKAHRVRAGTRARMGRIGAAEADLFEALIAARRSADHRQITAALSEAPNAALWGPSPAPKAGGRCLDVVRMQRMTTAAPSLEATSLRCLAVLELLRGRPDKARTMLTGARQIVADLGLRHALMETELFAGIIELLAGDAVAAEPYFRTALDGLDALGMGVDAGQAAALLARSLLAQGRIEEAEPYAAESERLAGRNLKTAIAWRAVRAEILAAQGHHGAAATFGREAVALAADTDLVLDHADACLALSRVLGTAGDTEGAAEAYAQAEALYTAKEAVFLTQSAVAAVAPSAPSPESTRPTSRLPKTNRASRALFSVADASSVRLAADCTYDDRRRISGEPIVGNSEFAAAAQRKSAQYPHVETPLLAVRGESLALFSLRWRDDAGNETASLDLYEVGDDDALRYWGRFDEDDLAGAYTELERRYYAGEGAPFAENGLTVMAFAEAMRLQDIDSARPLIRPGFRWRAAASALKPIERTIDDLFEWRAARLRQVSSFDDWLSAIDWLSPGCSVALCQARGYGVDGSTYSWSRVYVTEYRDGLVASVGEFAVDDEEAAFAYAESLGKPDDSLLPLTNRASAVADALDIALEHHDPDAAVALLSEHFDYDDRRHFGGDPIDGPSGLRRSVERLMVSYRRFEAETLAVRGERLWLGRSLRRDEAGNSSSNIELMEVSEDGAIAYFGRFDEDDFWIAYDELERRFFAGEGAEFATGGLAAARVLAAFNRDDLDSAREDCAPCFRWYSATAALTTHERSIEEVFQWMKGRGDQVSSQRYWAPVVRWLSPECAVSRNEISALGPDSEEYRWTQFCVSEYRNGLPTAVRQFETEREAFEWVESLIAPHQHKLTLENQAVRRYNAVIAAMRAYDVDSAAAAYAADFVYEDRRQFGGDPVLGHRQLRSGMRRILHQYNHSDTLTLAVRGDLLQLLQSRWSDTSGNETEQLHLVEIDDAGKVIYEGRFDEDDFLTAYAEMERRYYTGEGAEFATGGLAAARVIEAFNRNDLEAARRGCAPGFRWYAPDTELTARERSIEDMFQWMRERGGQVASQRYWTHAIRWLSSECAVSRNEISALGLDGEEYRWTQFCVTEIRNCLAASVHQFATEREAFDYADSAVPSGNNELAVTNRASVVLGKFKRALNDKDVDGALALHSPSRAYDDRRRLSGKPLDGAPGIHMGIQGILRDYNHFELEIAAVRGTTLALARGRQWDDGGNAVSNIELVEIDDDGLISYHARFDEDDFCTAYAELERRYYTGEGAPFGTAGATLTELIAAGNLGDLDEVFDRMAPGLKIESRSRSIVPERTVADLRASVEQLREMTSALTVWVSAVHWLSDTWLIARQEREGTGPDGETYSWSRLCVGEIRDGLLTTFCEFDAEDEDTAFVEAERRMRARPGRLAITNRSSVVRFGVLKALDDGDFDAAARPYTDHLIYDDHRRLPGDPVPDRAGMRAAFERLSKHYRYFDGEVLAVRGDRLSLGHYRCADDAGNETTGLVLVEIDDGGTIVYEGRFDADDFDTAYRALDARYYAGEAVAYTAGPIVVAFAATFDSLDVEEARRYCHPDFRFYSPPGTLTVQERTVEDFFDWLRVRAGQVASVRNFSPVYHWTSPTCMVARGDVRATGFDGEHYTWARIYVIQLRDGLLASFHQFDDEDSAFAYAEGLEDRPSSPLQMSDQHQRFVESHWDALRAGDVDTVANHYREDYVFEDRRRLSGEPLRGRAAMRAALQRIRRQYNRFDADVLAFRGGTCCLSSSTWSDDSGNTSKHLHVVEIADEGHIVYEGRFDEDDFDSAYAELERRYYAGEGAPYAQSGLAGADVVALMNRGDLETMFATRVTEDLRVENHARSGFPDRSSAELLSSLEELRSMLGSVRSWFAALCFLSPTVAVGRLERHGRGRDGEDYAWGRILVALWHDGRLRSIHEFNPDDEASAFACAESLR